MIRNHDRKFKIGMHSYTLHLSGLARAGDFRNTASTMHLSRWQHLRTW